MKHKSTLYSLDIKIPEARADCFEDRLAIQVKTPADTAVNICHNQRLQSVEF